MPWPNWTRARPWQSISCSPAATATVCVVPVEVGDFAAGRAFLRAVEPKRLAYSPFVSLGELKATTLPPNSGGG